jgi:hypothetical protein
MNNSDYQYTTYPDFLNRTIIDGLQKLIKDTSKIIDYYQKYNYHNESQQLKCKLAMFQKAYIVIKNYRTEIFNGKELSGLRGISPGIPERINMILEYGITNDFAQEDINNAYLECPDVNENGEKSDDFVLFLDTQLSSDTSRSSSPNLTYDNYQKPEGYLNAFKTVSTNMFNGIKNNINPFNRVKNDRDGGYLEEDYDSCINIPASNIV